MADLQLDSASLGDAAAQIVSVAGGILGAGSAAVSAMVSGADAITHPGLQAAVDAARASAMRAHEVLHHGVSDLSRFATNTIASLEGADRDLGSAIRETMN